MNDRDQISHLKSQIQSLEEKVASLELSEKRFLEALRLSPMALCHHDRDLRYTWLYNPHMGFVQEDVIGKTDWDILPEDLANRMGAIKRRVLETGVGERVEMPTILHDENCEYFDLVVEPLKDEQSGEVIGLSCSGIDVTEDRRLREAFKASEARAEQASRAKSHFIASASHDLRQPLHAMGMLLGVLDQQVRQPSARKILDRVSVSHNALSDMLNGILDMSRLDAGAVDLLIEPVCLQDIFEELDCEFVEKAQAKGLDIRFVRCSALVSSDEIQLQRVLRNLIENAIAYTARGKILIGCRKQGDMVGIYVYDTGIGIAQDQQSHIFEEFRQLDNPARDRRKGFGLGLAICEKIASLLETRIQFRSEPNKGSVFWFHVPLAGPRDQEEGRIDPVSHPDLNDKTILYIEDEPDVRDATRLIFESWGLHVLDAHSIDHMREKLKKSVGIIPDLILADYRLAQQETGLEAILAARNLLNKDLPAVILSGDTTLDLTQKAEKIGLRVLTKPLQPSLLQSCLVTLLQETP